MNLEYLFAAYTLILAALFLYIYTFTRRQQSVEKELESLRRMLEGSGEVAED